MLPAALGPKVYGLVRLPAPPVPGPEVNETSTFPFSGMEEPPTNPTLAELAAALSVVEPPAQDHVELELLPEKLKSIESAKAAPVTKRRTATVVRSSFLTCMHYVLSFRLSQTRERHRGKTPL